MTLPAIPLAIAPGAPELEYFGLEADVLRRLAQMERDRERGYGAPPYQMVGSVAVIRVHGALMKSAPWWSCGACYSDIVAAARAAAADPRVGRILLDVDSPGGEIHGCEEASRALAELGASMPIDAYVTGRCQSAAYWLVSGTRRIVASPTASIGCLGAMLMMVRTDLKDVKRYEFVSAQTPLKNADPGSEAGANQYQDLADKLAAIMLATIAEQRGEGAEDIAEKYGAGATFVAADALDRGMVDAIAVHMPLEEEPMPDTNGASGAPTPPPAETELERLQRENAELKRRAEAAEQQLAAQAKPPAKPEAAKPEAAAGADADLRALQARLADAERRLGRAEEQRHSAAVHSVWTTALHEGRFAPAKADAFKALLAGALHPEDMPEHYSATVALLEARAANDDDPRAPQARLFLDVFGGAEPHAAIPLGRSTHGGKPEEKAAPTKVDAENVLIAEVDKLMATGMSHDEATEHLLNTRPSLWATPAKPEEKAR